MEATSQGQGRRVSKINFLGDQKYHSWNPYFFSVIFLKKSL
jgi:hypothetical protein